MANGENDQITLAVLSQQIVTLTAEISAMRTELRENGKYLTEARITQSRHDTEIKNLTVDQTSLSVRVNSWSALNSLGVVIAAVVGLMFGGNKP